MSEVEAAQTEELPGGAEPQSAHADQYLTFTLADEDYGVNILLVEEIRGLESWTRIPNSPSFVRGVVNIRGAIVQVIDMRERFQLGASEYGTDTVIIVLRDATRLGNRALGVIADSVSDVHDAYNTQIGVTPEFGNGVNTEFISGLATVDQRMVMLIDVEKLMNHKDICDIPESDAA